MTQNAGDIAGAYPMRSAKRDRIELEAQATIVGGAGVVVIPLTAQDDPNMSVTRGGSAGLYNLVFPQSADLRGSLDVMLVSPAGTVKGWYVTAFAPNSGTAQIQLVNAAGAATDPAAADSFTVQLTLSMRKDF